MAIEEYNTNGGGGCWVRLTACPMCGEEFGDTEQPAMHIRKEHDWDDLELG